jgi:hypothetical protein
MFLEGDCMPNFTENRVVISGAEHDVAESTKSLIRPVIADQNESDERCEIDFGGLLPAPNFRQAPKAPEPNILHRALYGEVRNEDIERWSVGDPEHEKINIPEKLDKLTKAYRVPFVRGAITYLTSRSGFQDGTEEREKYLEELLEDVQAMQENLTRNGSPTLYDWMMDNWGSNYSCTVQVSAQLKGAKKYSTEIFFLTPWSGVFPVVSEFAKNNPKVLIKYLTTDEENDYSMTYRFKKGELVNAEKVKRRR